MSRPFEPVGDEPRWKPIYRLLAEADVDEVVTYDDLARAIDVDPVKQRNLIQANMPRASRELLEQKKRAPEVVRNTGYRIVKPVEHLDLAHKREKRAERHLVKGSRVVANVDYAELDTETRKAFEVVGRVFQWQIAAMRRLDVRQKDLEKSLAAVQTTVQQTQKDQESYDERLAWLEARERERQQRDSA